MVTTHGPAFPGCTKPAGQAGKGYVVMTELRKLKPSFRADHVGSLLRPRAVRVARDRGITGEALREIEDREIPALIKMQEDAGLRAVTDGEARRRYWHYDFLGMLTNYEIIEDEAKKLPLPFRGVKLPPVYTRITGPLDFPEDHPMLEHFRFVARHTGVMPKICIPGPSCAHYRVRPEDVSYKPYRDDPESLFQAIARTYKKAVQCLYDAGCRYLQLDDIYFAYLCDPRQRAERRAMGQDPDDLINRYVWMLEEAIKDRPADMLIAMHMCRGNYCSTFAAAGSYDVAADVIFNLTSVDVYFMEWDTPRAGSLSPLRRLPRGGKRVMPGFISTWTPEIENMDDICRRFDQAAEFVDWDQLGIAPQCGFSSSLEGNKLTQDDQRRKLELVVRVAEKLWGSV